MTEVEFLQSVFDADFSLDDASFLEESRASVLACSELRLTIRIPSDDAMPEALLRCSLLPGYPEVTTPLVHVDCAALSKAVLASLSEELMRLAAERLGSPSLFD